MNEPLISVIVPIYNVEKYLNKCIESIVNQTYKNLEIILVDDGSPDKCPQICDEWAKKDKRIKVIHKENGGLSDARNTGLDNAKGDFISFIDSDDWISKSMYAILIKEIKKYDCDIIECGINYINDINGEIIRITDCQNKCIFNVDEAMFELVNEKLLHQVVWNKLYRKECINGFLFKFGKYNEDEFWTYRVIHQSKKVMCIPNKLYFYRQRGDSIMGNFSAKNIDALEARYERLNFFEEYYPNLVSNEQLRQIYLCIYFYQKVLISDIDKKIRKKALNKIKKYYRLVNLNTISLKKLTTKEKINIILSKCSIGLCAKIRNFFNIGI